MSNKETKPPADFIRQIIADDLASGKHETVITRFPPEPNGYLHIGHAKSITLNFGVAGEIKGGRCHLRFDDSNPETEDMEYVQSIQKDVRWLGYDWGEHIYYASDYFEDLYGFAVNLIEQGKAYVCSLSEEEIRQYRGTVTGAGKHSPYRDRPVEENLDLFARMKAGEFADGEHVLRAKIDMEASNMKMRDPLLYRIRHAAHYRTGRDWCIYPMYDFTHCLSDALENITHSICTLEFENNRELYDWIIDNVPAPAKPLQYEFARLNLNYTVMSKRKLIDLVQDGHVNGWDDPRLPTIAGMRRRGITPEAIRNFCERIGVAKANSVVDMALLEHSVRDDLNTKAPRVMGVLDPLKVVITNYPQDQAETDEFDAPYLPDDPPKMGTRKVPFSREIYIERKDFMEDPPKKFFRLAPGREVRLRWAYFITCVDVVKDDNGEVVEIHCEYDPATRGGDSPDGRKVKGTIHWVSAEHSVPAEVRLYDRLFTEPNPDGGKGSDYIQHLNPHSLDVVNARVERSLASSLPGDRFQFERTGYFIADSEDHAEGNLVFNRIVPLRDSWAKIAAKEKK
jgi:glutaminyl-tRNA synthetase